MIAKLFDIVFTCDETLQTYADNVLDVCKKDQNVPIEWNVPNYVPSSIYLDLVFYPDETRRARLDCQDGLAKDRAVGYLIPCSSFQFEFFRLLMIYIGMPWLPMWLVSLLTLFKRKESVHRLSIGLYTWLDSFEKYRKGKRTKGRTIDAISK